MISQDNTNVMSSKISSRLFLSDKKNSSHFDEELNDIGNVENRTALKKKKKKLIVAQKTLDSRSEIGLKIPTTQKN